MTVEYDWDALAEQAEAGTLVPVAGTALYGEAAAAAGREILMAATGTTTIEEATRVALGRPRLGAPLEENVTWKVRAPSALDHMVEELAKREGKSRSALIRAAVAEYASTRQLA